MRNLCIITAIILMVFMSLLPAQTWKYLSENNSTLPSNAILNILFDEDQSRWFCTMDSGLIHLQNGEFHAFNSLSNDGFSADYVSVIAKSSDNTYWIGTEYKGLYKFKDGVFTQYQSDNAGHELKYLRSMVLQNGGPANGGAVWIGTWGRGLFKFDGSQWAYFDQTSGVLPDNSVLALAEESNPGGEQSILWVGTNRGLLKYDGSNWQNISVNGQSDLWINGIALKNGGPTFGSGELLIGTESGQFDIFDGSNWTIFNMADAWNPNNSVTGVVVDSAGVVWFGQDEEGLGMYDGKQLLSFYKDNSGIAGNNVVAVAVQQNNDSIEVWCSTYDNGGYDGISILVQASATGLAHGEFLPGDISLEQNYPNPFNPTTHIRFRIAKTEQVRLAVFNALGQRVRTLVNQRLAGGNYDITFTAGYLPAGIYLYKLQAGPERITRKMLLLQ